MKYIAILTTVLLFALTSQKPIFAQQDSLTTSMDTNFVDSIDYSINEYDKYTPKIGGEEFRTQNGLKINGMIKDYYPDSTLKHRGYYTNGQLLSMYKNYYPNGQLERSFTVSGTSKLIIESFWPNGNPKEYIEYRKGEIVIYSEYYSNGVMEMFEEHDRKKGYYLTLKHYYKNGMMKSSLELLDKKKLSYVQREYYPSGKIKEEGPVLYNPFYYDYQRQGTWKVYSESGNLVETQEYYEGELIQ
jgi:antitoxin component YwqK of YwqJK toxin-antitoxin module